MTRPRKPDLPLATALRQLRHRQGLTQEALALNAHVTVSTLSRIERGLSDPAWTTILTLVRVLDIKLDELVTTIEGNDA